MKVGYLLLVLAAGLGVMFLSGCSGKLYIGYDRTDTVTETRTMADKSWYCAWVNCERGTEK